MRFRRNVWGFGSSLTAISFALTFSAGALAQPETESPAPPAEEAPPADALEEDAPQEKEPPRAPDQASEPKTEAVRKDAEEIISVRVLPGSAFPEPKVRGIKGGSLWLTMHGLQWPYQPRIAAPSGVQFGFSGSAWVDTAYTKITSNNDNDRKRNLWTNQSRGVLRATPAYSTEDDWFVQGQLEFVAQGDQTVISNQMGAIDDLYVRAGKWGWFDITAGRFQGWEIYHYGMGLDLNTFERSGARPGEGAVAPPAIYGVDFFWDRPNAGSGNYAAHIYPTDFLRFELLGRVGTTGGNVFAFRPVGILDLGVIKVKAGGEWGKVSNQKDCADCEDSTTSNGFGGAVQFVLNPYVEGGANFGIGYVDKTTADGLRNDRASTTTTSFGGFVNGRVFGPLLVGVGANLTTLEPLEQNAVAGSVNLGKSNQYKQFLGFAAVQYSFWDRLYLKMVVSRASYDIDDNIQEPPHDLNYDSSGARFRMMYLF